MARPKKDEAPDLAQACDLTAGAIDRLTCPTGKAQTFLRDIKAPGLPMRVTAAGAKSYVFEAKLKRQTIRRTIGDVRAWSIEGARAKANRLRVMLDGGTDPRALERQKEAEAEQRKAATAAQEAAAVARAVTVADVWPRYMAEGKPKRKAAWKARYVADLQKAASMGGK
jgi:hypothetical protein